jgi:CobQ/CobB/MinD/ParA nucleotide binding domain
MISQKDGKMKQVHFLLNGKGGVGKSTISNFFIQYLKEHSTATGIDCDASNNTLFDYKALNIKQIRMTGTNSNIIDKSKFDNVMEEVINSTTEHIVIDSGASSFLEQMDYMITTNIFSLLQENDCNIHIHLVIAGGDMLKDSYISAKNIILQINNDKIKYSLWLNEYFGSFVHNDKHFIDTNYYKAIKDSISSIITLKKQSSDLLEKDIQKMLSSQLIFDEIKEDSNFTIFEKSRLFNYKKELFNSIKSNIFA